MDTEGGTPVTATAKVPSGFLKSLDVLIGQWWERFVDFLPRFCSEVSPVLFLFGMWFWGCWNGGVQGLSEKGQT